MRRLQLFYYCGQVALINVCLPQVDTFFKSAIALIPDVPAYETVHYERTSTEMQVRVKLSRVIEDFYIIFSMYHVLFSVANHMCTEK